MDNYLVVLTKPEFVISIVITIALFLFEPVLSKMRRVIYLSVTRSSVYLRGIFRGLQARHKRKLKNLRQNGDEVTYQIIRSHTYFILFIGSIGFYLGLMALGPLKGLGELPVAVQLLITVPIYIFEIIWLVQGSVARDLVDYRGRLHVTSAGSRMR